MIKNYKDFIKESLLDKMAGPSDEEIYDHYKKQLLKGRIDIFEYYELSKKYNFDEPTNKELLDNFNSISFEYDYFHHIQDKTLKIIKLLLEKQVITVEDVYNKAKMSNNEKLIFSIDINDYKGAVNAVKLGAEINSMVSNSIARACFHGTTEIFKYLIKKSTDMLGYRDWGTTDDYLISTAMQQGHYDIFEILIKYNLDIAPSRLDTIKKDPKLSVIYNKEHKKPINKFIRFFNGTNESLLDKLEGPTKEEIIKSLEGYTGYDLIKRSCKAQYLPGVIKGLKDYDNIEDGIDDAFADCVEFGFIEGIEYTLNNGADKDTIVDVGDWMIGVENLKPLEYAAYVGNDEVLEFLLKNGFDEYKDSACRVAVAVGDIDIVKRFMSLGVKLLPYDLQTAISENYLKMVKFLLSNGVKVTKETIEYMDEDQTDDEIVELIKKQEVSND